MSRLPTLQSGTSQRNSGTAFIIQAGPWDNGDISFTGGIQPLMMNALTDEGPSGIDYRERGPMWRWSRPERKAKLSISINHHHTEPAQNADVGCMPGLLLPGRAGIALVALNGGQNVENANGLTVARLPDAESTALRFNFAVGQAPFLVIPQSGRTITLRQGGAVAVNWSSNRAPEERGHCAKVRGLQAPTSHVAVLLSGSHWRRDKNVDLLPWDRTH